MARRLKAMGEGTLTGSRGKWHSGAAPGRVYKKKEGTCDVVSDVKTDVV
jgi:hypothetical protein